MPLDAVLVVVVDSIALRRDGAANMRLYVKEMGTGNTGSVEK
jgi:hypothetical protein